MSICRLYMYVCINTSQLFCKKNCVLKVSQLAFINDEIKERPKDHFIEFCFCFVLQLHDIKCYIIYIDL